MSAPSAWTLMGVAAGASVLLGATRVATTVARRASAALRHALWSAALAGVLVLPLAAAVLPHRAVHLPVRTSPDLPTTRASLADAASRSAHASRTARLADARERMWEGMGEGASGERMDLGGLLAIAWCIGTIVVLARTLHAHRLAAAIARRALPVQSGAVRRVADDVAARLGVRGPIDVRASAELAAPAVLGIRRAIVLLPECASSWDVTTLRPVLEHEVAHVARRDALTDVVAALACAVHWYNPLAWHARRALARERERACDDIVLAGGTAPDAYAGLLIAVARAAAHAPSPVPASALALARVGELEARVRAILDASVSRQRASRAHTSTCGAAVMLAALGCATVRVEGAATASSTIASPSSIPASVTARTLLVAAPRLPAPEPDLLSDSVARPRSERVAAGEDEATIARQRAAAAAPTFAAGPDSMLASHLARALAHVPDGEADLVRERAAWALLVGRDGRLVEPLVDSLASADWRVRAYAMWALGYAGVDARRDPRAEPRLIEALTHPVWRVRAAAAWALRDVGTTAALPAMRHALDDAAWQVRTAAVTFVGTMDGEPGREAARRMLADRHVAVRNTARALLAGSPLD